MPKLLNFDTYSWHLPPPRRDLEHNNCENDQRPAHKKKEAYASLMSTARMKFGNCIGSSAVLTCSRQRW